MGTQSPSIEAFIRRLLQGTIGEALAEHQQQIDRSLSELRKHIDGSLSEHQKQGDNARGELRTHVDTFIVKIEHALKDFKPQVP